MNNTMYQIQPGYDVRGADGEKVGEVSEVASQYLLVTKGFIFVHDMYIPTSAVTEVADETVYLNVTKDQIESMGWNEPPMGSDSGFEGSADGAYVEQRTGTDTGYDTGYQSHTDTDDRDSVTVQRHEEELQAQKRMTEAGGVEVRKDVVEEQQSFEVPVMREQVEVTSRVVDRPATGADADAFQDGDTIRVPIREEVVEVTKAPRVVEELEIRKTAHQDTETVTGTVRKEQIHVDEHGSDGDLRGDRDR